MRLSAHLLAAVIRSLDALTRMRLRRSRLEPQLPLTRSNGPSLATLRFICPCPPTRRGHALRQRSWAAARPPPLRVCRRVWRATPRPWRMEGHRDGRRLPAPCHFRRLGQPLRVCPRARLQWHYAGSRRPLQASLFAPRAGRGSPAQRRTPYAGSSGLLRYPGRPRMSASGSRRVWADAMRARDAIRRGLLPLPRAPHPSHGPAAATEGLRPCLWARHRSHGPATTPTGSSRLTGARDRAPGLATATRAAPASERA